MQCSEIDSTDSCAYIKILDLRVDSRASEITHTLAQLRLQDSVLLVLASVSFVLRALHCSHQYSSPVILLLCVGYWYHIAIGTFALLLRIFLIFVKKRTVNILSPNVLREDCA